MYAIVIHSCKHYQQIEFVPTTHKEVPWESEILCNKSHAFVIKKIIMKKSFDLGKIIVLAIILGVGLQYAIGAWREPPAAPPNEIVSTSTPACLRNACWRLSPAANVRSPCLLATSSGSVLACRLWLTLRISLADSENGGDVSNAT